MGRFLLGELTRRFQGKLARLTVYIFQIALCASIVLRLCCWGEVSLADAISDRKPIREHGGERGALCRQSISQDGALFV